MAKTGVALSYFLSARPRDSDTYCEMGIDVRAYAKANQDVKRAACVGCGMCAHVCPRGVLKLENKPVRWKAGQPIRVYAVDL